MLKDAIIICLAAPFYVGLIIRIYQWMETWFLSLGADAFISAIFAATISAGWLACGFWVAIERVVENRWVWQEKEST